MRWSSSARAGCRRRGARPQSRAAARCCGTSVHPSGLLGGVAGPMIPSPRRRPDADPRIPQGGARGPPCIIPRSRTRPPRLPARHSRPMPLHVLGINHHSAPLEVREKLAFPPERQADALAALAAPARRRRGRARLDLQPHRDLLPRRRPRRRCARGSRTRPAEPGLDIEAPPLRARRRRGRAPRLPRGLGPRFDGARASRRSSAR